MNNVCRLVLLVLAGCFLHTQANENEHSLVLDKLLDNIWQYEISQFPHLARSEGKTPSSSLTDISMPAMQARFEAFSKYLISLRNIHLNALNDAQQISYLMQEYRLQNHIDNFVFKEYRVPITSEYGFHSAFGRIPENTTLRTQEDVVNYFALLDAIPENMRLNMQYMKEGLAVGHSQPKVVLIGYEDTISPYTGNDIQEHPFYVPIANAKKDLLTASQFALAEQKVAAITNSYQAFYDFFVSDYKLKAKDEIATSTWPNGKAFYDNRIKHYTTTDLTAEEIHEIGLREVSRIRAEMQTIVDELKFDDDINAFIQFLRTDERFYAKSAKELIMVASYISKQMDARLPQLFYKMPRIPYGVAPVPDSIAPKYTTGRYISPRSDDQAGYYWVNTYALDKRPLYALPALTLHEAVPGHHFQISLAAELENLPNVRRKTYISAFGEGWGLYAEYLGLEVGIYEDPYDNFGRLSYEMWRACRLVVDTGMHVFGWSREKAMNYMLENTALSEHNVRTEIDRYISWPAQALSYKIGEIKIKELRQRAEIALGDQFDLRAFHDAVLAHGSVPLFILERNIDHFIAAEKSKS